MLTDMRRVYLGRSRGSVRIEVDMVPVLDLSGIGIHRNGIDLMPSRRRWNPHTTRARVDHPLAECAGVQVGIFAREP